MLAERVPATTVLESITVRDDNDSMEVETMKRYLTSGFFFLVTAALVANDADSPPSWPQWGRNQQHIGFT